MPNERTDQLHLCFPSPTRVHVWAYCTECGCALKVDSVVFRDLMDTIFVSVSPCSECCKKEEERG